MTALVAVPYEASRRSAVFDLMNRVWGGWLGSEDFEWWFHRSPHGPGLITLMEDGEAVVGIAAMSRFRAVVRGTPQLVAVPLQVATDPDYRGRGIFQRLELENERRATDLDISTAVTFPNPASARVFTGALGWSELPSRRVWARLLHPLRAARAVLGGVHERPVGPAPGPGRLRGIDVRPIDAFETDSDELCARASRGYPNHFLRDAAHLEWRYLRSSRPYRCYGAYEAGSLEGVAVTGETDVGSLRAAFIADLIAAPGSTRIAAALLERCLADARPGAEIVLALPPAAPSQRRVFARAGFVPTPKRIRMLGKELHGNAAVAAKARDWHVVLGDLDFF